MYNSSSFAGNEIVDVDFISKKLSRLTLIEMRGNKLTTTKGLNMRNLQKIYLGENNISRIADLDDLQHLTTLFLRQNDISNLDGFSENMLNLQYLNLR